MRWRVKMRGGIRAAHRPFYGYGRQITAVEISSKSLTVRPGIKTAVNGYYGRFRVMTLTAASNREKNYIKALRPISYSFNNLEMFCKTENHETTIV